MRRRALAALLVVILALGMANVADAAESPTLAIDNCIARLDPEVDVGYERIAAVCPSLAQTLEQSGFAQWLPLGWKETRNNLSAGSLAELRAVVDRELATRPATRIPNVEHLTGVLAGLGNQHVQTSSAWDRFKRWLHDLTERRESTSEPNWFDHMVSRGGLSAAVGAGVTYIALGAVVVLALVIIVNEVKAAAMLRRRSDANAKQADIRAPVSRAVPTASDIDTAPLIERPAMWLQRIASKLTAMGRLPPSSALTVYEMERSVNLHGEQDRARFTALARTTERARFAPEGVLAADLEKAVDDGRALFESVSAPYAAADGESAQQSEASAR